MFKSFRLLSFALTLFFWSGLLAQTRKSEANPIIKKDLLLQDLQILKKNLEVAQPGLYNYTSKQEMDLFFENIKDSIVGDMHAIDFFRLIAPLSNKIRNGHTILVPPSKWEDHVITEEKLLPLDLYFYNDGLYVLHNLSNNPKIERGSVLKSINGKPANYLFGYVVDRWFKDGYNTTRPREIAEEEFRFLYTHFFNASNTYNVEFVDTHGQRARLALEGITEPEFQKRLKARFNKDYVPWWRKNPEPLSLAVNKGIAHLKVTQFYNGLRSMEGMRFGKFIKDTFKRLNEERITDLILDLRGNSGGNVEPQIELLKHLISKPFHLYREVYANVRKLPNPEYYEFGLLSKTAFRKNFSKEPISGVYPMRSQIGFEEKPEPPSENVFTGNLYVLIDGWSFSAAGEVCGVLKEHRKDAIFLGEETGGNPITNISGIQTFLTLPNSKSRILVCLVSYTTDVSYENDGFGVKPHITIRNSVFDVLEGKDRVLEKTNALIFESRSQ